MTHQYKRIDEEEEESLLGLKRKLRVKRERAFKQGSSRFPHYPDGRQYLGFATLTHGSLRTWAKLRDAQGHNTRVTSGPNIRQDAPEPIELLTEATGSYEDRVRRILAEHDVPDKIRTNGCVATEDIYGASPEYWDRHGDWKTKDPADIVNDPVVQRAVVLARKRHGPALVSCALHLDEASPHVHVIAVPLVKKLHRKRGRKPKSCALDVDGKPIDKRPVVEKWSIDWSTLRGRTAHLELAHDAWAAAVDDLGLARGSKGSEMTEEERRTRRQLQTARASEGGKRIREERDRILTDAEKRADEIISEAESAARDSLADIKGANAALDVRERELKGRAAYIDEQKADLDAKKADLAEREKALIDQAEVQAARRQLNDRMDTILRELDQRLQEKTAEHEQRKAKLERQKEDVDRRSRDLVDAFDFLQKVVQPGGDALIATEHGRAEPVDQGGMIPDWWTGLPEQQRAQIEQGLVAILNAAAARKSLAAEQAKLTAARTSFAAEMEALKSRAADLNNKWGEYDRVADAVMVNIDLAMKFRAAWDAVPEVDRTPAIQGVVEKAQKLIESDYPPGFSLPGKKGYER